MNYYKRHIGDYAAATRHLSILEHGIYTLAIDFYYNSEQPLPVETKEVCRKLGARSKEECAAVESVLHDFFMLTDAGWVQSRCDTEIAEYQRKAETNRVTGSKGGRPKKQTTAVNSGNPEITQTVLSQNPEITLTTNQEPITTNQEPVLRHDSSAPPSRAGEVCVVVKNAGIGIVNPQHPQLAELLADGATVQNFEDAARIASANGKGFAYCLGIVKGRLDDEKRAPKRTKVLETFRERDDRLAAERIAEFMPSIAAKQPRDRNVIDITPQVQITALEA
jgi:uncharacterized protein YdaU (DUF1376 family)